MLSPRLLAISTLLLGLLVALCHPVCGQVSYNGQMVHMVELVSAPSLDTGNLRRLVQQQSHQPYSEDKVQATKAALERTGMFHSVRVEVRPEVEGLRVMFVLEPAFYYGLVRFPGASKVFTYTRLLQVVNLPDQEPYEEMSITKAQTSLLDFLHKQGYFDAKVVPKVELDHAHGIANVDFATQLGKKARIGKVNIEGVPPAEAVRLRSKLHSWRAKLTGAEVKPGKPYGPKRLDDATKLLKNDLANRGYLASRLHFDMTRYYSDTHHADINLQVDERNRIDIKVVGARLSWLPFLASREKRKLLPFYQEGTVDVDLVEEGRRNLLSHFQSKGYFDAAVRTSFQRQPQESFLVYNIQKHKKHKVANIAFRGNHNIDEDDLIQQVAVKKGRFFLSRGKFSNQLAAQSAKSLNAYYQQHGYEDATITPEVLNKGANVDIVFNIAEGEQTRVASIKLDGNRHLAVKDMQPKDGWQLKQGGAFSPNAVTKDRGQMLAAYLDHGYLSAEVKTNVSRYPDNPHLVDVTYNISEGQQVHISQIVYYGAPHTRRSLINKSVNLWPEAPLSQTDLLKAESQLYDEGIFEYASVGPRRPIEGQTEEEVVIKMHESKRNDITYGFGLEIARRGGNVPSGTVAVPGLPTIGLGNAKISPSEQTFVSPRGTIEFIRHNMRGLAETASLSLLAARLHQRAVLTYAMPHFHGSSWRALFSGSTDRSTENPLFAANVDEGSVQLEKTLDAKKTMTAQVRYTFGHTRLGQLLIPDLVLPQDRNVRLSTFSGTLIRDTRDKPLDAHRGFFQTADFGITADALGASATFARLLIQNAYYKPLPHDLVWANNVRFGAAKPLAGSRVPTSELFFSGGGTTLRGFPINGAGPQREVPVCSNPSDPSTCSNITVPVGGKMLVVLNEELRYPIPVMDNLGGVIFYDGGNVFTAVNVNRFIDNYTNTVGLGLRYSTPIGPVRFDVGRNLNPIPGIRATQFFVTLGQAF
jgi:outer membrane protein insertion porin family